MTKMNFGQSTEVMALSQTDQYAVLSITGTNSVMYLTLFNWLTQEVLDSIHYYKASEGVASAVHDGTLYLLNKGSHGSDLYLNRFRIENEKL